MPKYSCLIGEPYGFVELSEGSFFHPFYKTTLPILAYITQTEGLAVSS